MIDKEALEQLQDILGDELQELIDYFRDTTPSIIKDLYQAQSDQDIEELISKSHLLKGASGNIGLSGVAERCGELEMSLRNQDDIDLHTAIATIEEHYLATIKELDSMGM